MGLGPSLSIRQSQQLVLTPQLTQAIKLLQLSNLELDAYVAEEIAKNPLLESASDDDRGEASGGDDDPEFDSSEAPEDPGADDLILGQADDDRPLDVDWTSEALETDSFADVGGVSRRGRRLGERHGGQRCRRARGLGMVEAVAPAGPGVALGAGP